ERGPSLSCEAASQRSGEGPPRAPPAGHSLFGDARPPRRDRAKARPHSGRATDLHGHRLFGASWQSSKEGLKKGIRPRYAAALVGTGPKEQIFGADEPRTGAKQPRSIRLNAMQSGKGRNSTSSRSANLPRPLMVGAFFRSGLGGSRPSMRISIWAPQIGTTSAPFP